MNDLFARIEGASGGNEELRVLLQTLVRQQDYSNNNQGITWLNPGGNTQAQGSVAPPPSASLSVNGANGAFNAAITNPQLSSNATIWHEVSYSTVKGFTSDVTTMPVTSATSVTVNAPGQNYFFRIRSSFDKVNWTGYTLASTTAISSGLVSSAATSAGGAFNQTNYGIVTSAAAGASASVMIQGAGGSLTSLVAVKGGNESVLPSATIVNVTPGTDQFVGWDGESYQLRPTLAQVLNDNMTPIGKVSVVDTGVPTLPVIVPIVSGGGVVGFDVTNQGDGITGPLTLTVEDPGGPGTGATTGAQTIQNGKLLSVAPGNAGSLYDSHTVVTVAGGVGPGVDGGGTAIGGNGGRLTAV